MKIRCTNPQHDDSTPSMEIYEDGGYCFVCGHVDRSIADAQAPVKEKEDLENALRYIKGLHIREIRGLQFPVDGSGYYIIWPNSVFYKKRLFGSSCRYLAPLGHSAPLYTYRSGNILILVEGEINAMSLKAAYPSTKATIASFGSASNIKISLPFSLNYSTVWCIIDKDAAGVAAGVWLKRELTKKHKKVNLIACEKDINEILQEEGTQGVQKWARENNLEM